MNPQALGCFIAYLQQACDAADRRFALLTCLSLTLAQKAKQPGLPLFADELASQLDAAAAADTEFYAALDFANQYAGLCGKPMLAPGDFIRAVYDGV